MSIRYKTLSPRKFEISTQTYQQVVEVNSLSENEIKDIQETFMVFDKDGVGVIHTDQLGIVMRSLGHSTTEAEVQKLIGEFDEKAEGKLQFDVFLHIMDRKMEIQSSNEEVLSAFKTFDFQETNSINVSDLRHLLTNLGDKFSEDEANDIISMANVNKEGNIQYEEFLQNFISLTDDHNKDTER